MLMKVTTNTNHLKYQIVHPTRKTVFTKSNKNNWYQGQYLSDQLTISGNWGSQGGIPRLGLQEVTPCTLLTLFLDKRGDSKACGSVALGSAGTPSHLGGFPWNWFFFFFYARPASARKVLHVWLKVLGFIPLKKLETQTEKWINEWSQRKD